MKRDRSTGYESNQLEQVYARWLRNLTSEQKAAMLMDYREHRRNQVKKGIEDYAEELIDLIWKKAAA